MSNEPLQTEVEVTEPVLLDSTGQKILEELKTQNSLLGIMTETTVGATDNLELIAKIVRSGKAPKSFEIGDQIIVPWKDVAADRTYSMPFDIMHFGPVTLQDGEEVPGMFLQSHYCLPFGVQFDNYEAAYCAETELPSGTYHFTLAETWSKAAAGAYQFTLEHPVPAGGLICFPFRFADIELSAAKVTTYENGSSLTAIESVTLTSGSGGTDLGTWTKAGDATLSGYQRNGYGYNRWSQSGLRQFLNSKKGVGEWWESQNKWDRAPDQLLTKAGFMSGFEDDFLSCLRPVKVTTALNTVTDDAVNDSHTEDTYDTFFLPSLQQIYNTPQLADVEGEAWTYWKRALGLPQRAGYHPNIYEAYKTYSLDNHASAQSCFLRSCNRGSGYYVWCMGAGGGVYGGGGAYTAYRCAPACVIC